MMMMMMMMMLLEVMIILTVRDNDRYDDASDETDDVVDVKFAAYDINIIPPHIYLIILIFLIIHKHVYLYYLSVASK